MTTVVLALHLLVTAVLIFLILLQKTEGNAAGGGFGGGVSLSSMMQPRSRPNALTRATSILALTFFATSITLALLARNNHTAPASIIAPAATTNGAPVPKVSDSVMETPEAPAPAAEVPADAAPAVPAVPAAPAVPK